MASFDLHPAPSDRSHRMPERKALVGCNGNELTRPLIQSCDVSDERKQYGAECQARSQGRWMSQFPSLSDYRAALCHSLARKTESEQDNLQMRLCYHVQVGSGLIHERAVGDWMIMDKHLFQVRSGERKSATNELVSTGGQMT